MFGVIFISDDLFIAEHQHCLTTVLSTLYYDDEGQIRLKLHKKSFLFFYFHTKSPPGNLKTGPAPKPYLQKVLLIANTPTVNIKPS